MNGLETSTRSAALGFLVLLAIALLPLASVELPPLFDYANHLARMAILSDDGRDPFLNKFYLVRWSPLPNLAMDAVVPTLARWMPLTTAGRLFVSAIYILIAGGIMLLYRAAWGRWSWWSCLGFFLLYNRTLLWGFLNYLFGIGLALCTTALWLALPRAPLTRILIVAPLTLAVFLCHLAAFGVLGLLLAGCEIVPAWAEMQCRSWMELTKRAATLAACFVLPVVIFIAWLPDAPGSLSYGHYWRKADLLFSIFDNYHPAFDVCCFSAFILILIVGGLKGRIHPRLGGAASLAALAYLAVPDTLFTGAGADHRLPPAIFAAIIPAIKPELMSRRWTLCLSLVTLTVFVFRIGVIEPIWQSADIGYRRDLQLLSLLPEGSRLAVATAEKAVRVGRFPEVHFPTMAIATRHAFVPSLFTFAAQQPVAFKPPFDAMAALGQSALLWRGLIEQRSGAKHEATAILANYDEVVLVDDKAFTIPLNPCLTHLGGTATFQLLQITHDGDHCR